MDCSETPVGVCAGTESAVEYAFPDVGVFALQSADLQDQYPGCLACPRRRRLLICRDPRNLWNTRPPDRRQTSVQGFFCRFFKIPVCLCAVIRKTGQVPG